MASSAAAAALAASAAAASPASKAPTPMLVPDLSPRTLLKHARRALKKGKRAVKRAEQRTKLAEAAFEAKRMKASPAEPVVASPLPRGDSEDTYSTITDKSVAESPSSVKSAGSMAISVTGATDVTADASTPLEDMTVAVAYLEDEACPERVVKGLKMVFEHILPWATNETSEPFLLNNKVLLALLNLADHDVDEIVETAMKCLQNIACVTPYTLVQYPPRLLDALSKALESTTSSVLEGALACLWNLLPECSNDFYTTVIADTTLIQKIVALGDNEPVRELVDEVVTSMISLSWEVDPAMLAPLIRQLAALTKSDDRESQTLALKGLASLTKNSKKSIVSLMLECDGMEERLFEMLLDETGKLLSPSLLLIGDLVSKSTDFTHRLVERPDIMSKLVQTIRLQDDHESEKVRRACWIVSNMMCDCARDVTMTPGMIPALLDTFHGHALACKVETAFAFRNAIGTPEDVHFLMPLGIMLGLVKGLGVHDPKLPPTILRSLCRLLAQAPSDQVFAYYKDLFLAAGGAAALSAVWNVRDPVAMEIMSKYGHWIGCLMEPKLLSEIKESIEGDSS